MMIRIRFLLLLAAILLLSPVRLHAQETGLLLGLRYMEPISKVLPYYAGHADSLQRPVYRTLLIARREGRLQLAGEQPGLMVPRKDRFWRVGTKRSVYNNWVEDFIWAAPEGQSPSLPGIQVYNGEYCAGHRVQMIHYAGPDHLALEQRSAGYCEDAAHPWYFNTFAVVPIDSTTHMGLPISALFGEAGRTALFGTAADFLARLPNQEQRMQYIPEPDEANWTLLRRQGRWVVRGRLDPGEIAQTIYADFDLNLRLPPSLAPHNTLHPSWEQVRAFAPDALDAFSSPGRDFLVILRPTRLTVHPLADGRIGSAQLDVRVPANATAVMTRWTEGPHIRQWASHLSRRPRGTAPGP